MTPTFNAYNRFGALVRSFNARDLAEAYRDSMAALGSPITLKLARIERRAA